MTHYNLTHLTQRDNQAVLGPIQDDEALLLYSIIKTCRLKTIVEIGGLSGYSAINFLQAVGDSGTVYTIDIVPSLTSLKHNHKVIIKNAKNIEPIDIDNNHIDLIFFDAHAYEEQMLLFSKFINNQLINEDSFIALHDTGTHAKQFTSGSYETTDGWVHQQAERKMVNTLVNEHGYSCINFHTKLDKHDDALPFRHGLTILKKFKDLIL
jgi:predicted O-methyltransferase YrrM